MLTKMLSITKSYRYFPIFRNIICNHKICGNSRHNTLSKLCLTRKIAVPFRFFQSNSTAASGNDVENKIAEEHLEKIITHLSGDIYQKNRVYSNVLEKAIDLVVKNNYSNIRQGLLLIRCCSELLPDESPVARQKLLEKVWSTLKLHTRFKVEHYNELLRSYIANNHFVNADTFIPQMLPVKPNEETFHLLLKASTEVGDINQAVEIISNMKASGIPATGRTFDHLILGQGKARNMNNIEEILTMLKSLKIKKSADTYTALIRAYIFNGKIDLISAEFAAAKKKGIEFSEEQIMSIVCTLAAEGLFSHVNIALTYLPNETLASASISPYMQSVCTQLVHQNYPFVALEIYKCLPLPSFGPKDDLGLHGRSFVRECVKASVPGRIISAIAQELMDIKRNPLALVNACEAALQERNNPLALELMKKMQQMDIPLRPHYFWPIFVVSSKSFGEKGVMDIISTMLSMDVQPDYNTLVDFVLPNMSFRSPQDLVKKLRDYGLTVTSLITPMLVILMSSGQMLAASQLYKTFDCALDADKLFRPLIKGYNTSGDVTSTIHILTAIVSRSQQKKRDWVGRFLCNLLGPKKSHSEIANFENIIVGLQKTKLKISVGTADTCVSLIPQDTENVHRQKLKDHIMALTDERVVNESEMHQAHILHPRDMDESSLSAHLIELEAKGMNTRGVLRRLLQLHCRKGDLPKARLVLQKCQDEEVYLSAGMRAAVFDLNVKSGELEKAEQCLAELIKFAPKFTLDEFKILDFASLMVLKGRADDAVEMIKDRSKGRHIQGGKQVELNCWKLLDTFATKTTPKETLNMFNILMQYNYCKPTNVILGPVIRSHLVSGNTGDAVQEFVRLANTYKTTPLKHELLCKIFRDMKSESDEDSFVYNQKTSNIHNQMVHDVLSVDQKLYGEAEAQISLVAALAVVGLKGSLRRCFLDPRSSNKLQQELLLRRCARLADDKQLQALHTIADCARDLRHIDSEQIYHMILKIHEANHSWQEALQLWYKLQELDVPASPAFLRTLAHVLPTHAPGLPDEIQHYRDTHSPTDTRAGLTLK